MNNVRSVVGMIKQSVLKQVKRGEWVKAKFYIWKGGRYNYHCNNRIIFLLIFF